MDFTEFERRVLVTALDTRYSVIHRHVVWGGRIDEERRRQFAEEQAVIADLIHRLLAYAPHVKKLSET